MKFWFSPTSLLRRTLFFYTTSKVDVSPLVDLIDLWKRLIQGTNFNRNHSRGNVSVGSSTYRSLRCITPFENLGFL